MVGAGQSLVIIEDVLRGAITSLCPTWVLSALTMPRSDGNIFQVYIFFKISGNEQSLAVGGTIHYTLRKQD